ncbi:LysR family transcriptional regulator [Streptomyces sp. NPDC048278]|uniref:LysR family transcriptional regulator n=1 Tax=Streptomyces sp. NPDC048278 TaxID=3155809 RepID=UPI0034277C06
MRNAVDLTLQQLRCFIAVAEELRFARAAERLHVAVPSVSQQITALERRLDTPLFHRTSRHVELTNAGAELLPLARQVTASMAAVRAWGEQRREGAVTLRLGLVVSSPVCSAILAEASRELPRIRWDIRHLTLAEALAAVRSGAVDAALVPELEPPSPHGIRIEALWSEGRVLTVAATHRLAGRTAVDIAETDDETFFGVESDVSHRSRWFAVPRTSGREPRIRTVRRGVEEVLDMCSAGLGVGIAGTTTALSHARPELAYVPVRDIPDMTVYLLRGSGHGPGPVAAFARLAVRVAGQVAGRYGARPPSASSPVDPLTA